MVRFWGQWNLLDKILREHSFSAAFDSVHMTFRQGWGFTENKYFKVRALILT